MRVQNPATNWYSRSLQLSYAHYCLSITSSTVCFSRPLRKMGMQWKGAGGGMSPSLERGPQPPLSVVPPRPAGSGVEKGLHTLLCLLCLRWRISSLSCQCSDCMWRRGRGCVASSEKISCLYFIFCSCSTFFFLPSSFPPPHASGMSEPYPSKPVF